MAGISTTSSAPWPIASKTRATLVCTLPVTIMMAHGALAMIRRVASTPSMPASKPIRIRFGVSFAQRSTASAPLVPIQMT